MAEFTVRVELHKANSEQYDDLHEKMEAKGYSREISGRENMRYKLPDAEYIATKNMTSSEVRDEVVNIALSVNDDPNVLVTKSSGRAWRLDKA